MRLKLLQPLGKSERRYQTGKEQEGELQALGQPKPKTNGEGTLAGSKMRGFEPLQLEAVNPAGPGSCQR